MRIIFAGTPSTALPSLERLHRDHEVIGVFTRPPAPVGRKRVLTPSPVETWAREHGLPVHTPTKLSDEYVATVAEADAVAVVAYGLLVPPELLDLPRYGWINLHYSLLPAYRGAAPVQAAIAAGEQVTGVSVFQIEEGLDTGPVFATAETEIGARETAGELLDRLSDIGAELLSDTLIRVGRGLEATPQAGEASYAPRLRSQDTRLDFRLSAVELDRVIRAYTPIPGAWCEWDGQRVKIGPATVVPDGPKPGRVSVAEDPIVGTGDGALALERIAPPGKGWMNAKDWARGVRSEIVWS